ncbi:MAG: CDP-alcohol phosphatidyltransferase family protein, partial [Myxococcales bacterium]|nr:CDP-alcohol phosphatidyltransferase family protein [Myxococcales bacterium]
MAISLDKNPIESTPANRAAAPALSRHAIRPALPQDEELPHAGTAREHFWNLPNTITLLRAAVVPVLLFVPLFPGEAGSAIFAWFYIVAAVSDLVDGWLARRGQMVTHIGKLLDPLA